ncbi:MAG: hypothetical protein R6X34_22305 [Chloroflexota bacterium]
MTDPTNLCPQCGRQMYFGGNGRSLQCEVCGYQQTIHKDIPTPAEIVRSLNFVIQFSERSDRTTGSQGARLLLVQGIEAVKEGNAADAVYYLEWTLRAGANDEQCAEAWIWLSQLYDDPQDKRLCLEHALAHQPMNPIARRGLAVIDGRLQTGDIIDPNQKRPQPDPDAAPQAVKSEQFQCPRCASRMNYTADHQALLCEFCDYRQELNAPESRVQPEYGIGGLENDFIAALSTAKGHSQPVAMRAVQCMGCAVEFVLAPETLSLTCPYCNAVYVTEAAETRDILPPQALIPFTITEDDVKLALRDWVKRHKIQRPRVSPIAGLYAPLWTFDISGEMAWRGFKQQGDSWVPASGSQHVMFDDMLVPAAKKRSKLFLKEIHHFDYAQLVPYDPRYLADWPAERYQLTLADASLRARKQIVTDIRRRPYKLIPGEDIKNFSLNTTHLLVESYKLILVPMWLVHFKVEDQVYDVVVNGQNGRVRGDRPQNAAGKLFSWLKGE